MNRNEEWNGFLSNLLSCAVKERNSTKESEYLNQRQEWTEEVLATNLTADQKIMVEQALL